MFVPAGAERLELSGLVEHAGTGRAASFVGPEGLVDVVVRELELSREAAEPDTREKEEG